MPSLALSDDVKVVPEDVHEGGATPKPSAVRKSYIRRHWRGELPLGLSYWVNNVLLSFLLTLPWYGLKGDSFDAWVTKSPKLVGVSVILLWVFIYMMWGWQVVGLWRSARSHIANTRKSFWARAAQIMVVLGCLVSVNTFAETAWPQIKQYGQIAFGFGDYGGFTVRVIRQGKELEVIGGMAFGLTEEVNVPLPISWTQL